MSAAWYCSHYLCCCRCLVLLTPATNLPPVSTIPTVSVAKFAAGVVDTSGKFATGVADTGGAPWAALLSFWLFYPFGKVTWDFVSPSARLFMYSILFWPFCVISASVVNPLLRGKYQIVPTNLFHRYVFSGSACCVLAEGIWRVGRIFCFLSSLHLLPPATTAVFCFYLSSPYY